MKILSRVSTVLLLISFVLGLTGPIAAFAAGPATVNLGSAGNFVILAKSGISTTGPTSITGDIGVSPIVASGITGFGLIIDSSNTFSTSSLITGKAYAADYTAPTPATMTAAISDMQTAYTDAAGRTLPTATELGAGNIGGMTLAPGLYKWGTSVTIPTDLTLSGSANDVWIFQIAQNLNISSATHVILSGGAQAANIFWQVAGQTTLGTTSVFNGNILDQTAIVLNTGAILNGRALAQTAVTLDSNSVTKPSYVAVTPTPTPTPTPSPTPTPTPTPTQTPTPTIMTPSGHLSGSVVKTSDGTVWFITSDNMRRAFTSAGAFLSYGSLSFSQVVDANSADIALPSGAFIPPMDGKVICSDRDDSYAKKGTCYLITNGNRAAFTSDKVFAGLGFKFNRTTTGDTSFMPTAANINDTISAHRPGVLINNNGTIQVIRSNGLTGIPSEAVFNSWGYNFADVVPANAADLAMVQSNIMLSRQAGQLNPAQ